MIYKAHRNGKVEATYACHKIVITGRLVGTIGRVPCFDSIRVVDAEDMRRARDVDTRYFRGPVTFDCINTDGKLIGRFALADAIDLDNNPRATFACDLIVS